jgi:hypothetical protein
MAFRPNYQQQRGDRNRAKEETKKERLARREDFEFEHHHSGPNMDRTPNQILKDISDLAGVDLSEAFRLNSVGAALRWHTRYARQNGIHFSPTFSIDRIVEPNMSSGQTIEEWAALLKPHFAS